MVLIAPQTHAAAAGSTAVAASSICRGDSRLHGRYPGFRAPVFLWRGRRGNQAENKKKRRGSSSRRGGRSGNARRQSTHSPLDRLLGTDRLVELVLAEGSAGEVTAGVREPGGGQNQDDVVGTAGTEVAFDESQKGEQKPGVDDAEGVAEIVVESGTDHPGRKRHRVVEGHHIGRLGEARVEPVLEHRLGAAADLLRRLEDHHQGPGPLVLHGDQPPGGRRADRRHGPSAPPRRCRPQTAAPPSRASASAPRKTGLFPHP